MIGLMMLDNDTPIQTQGSVNGQGNELITDTLDYETLNEKQKMVFRRIESHYNDMLKGCQVGPLRIIVMGIAGTGKTYLAH